MSVEIWSAIIGVLGTMFGVLVGSWMSRKAAVDILAAQAKADFASSFVDTLKKLHEEPSEPSEGNMLSILQEDFPMHFRAYLKLKATLPEKQRAAIDKAWRNYSLKSGDLDLADAIPEEQEFYRFCHVLDSESGDHQKALAIKHVNKLLASIVT